MRDVMSLLPVLRPEADNDPEGDPEDPADLPPRPHGAATAGEAGELYAALWTHGRDDPRKWRESLEDGLSAAGLQADLVEAGLTDVHDDLVRASHQAGMDAIGGEAGCCRWWRSLPPMANLSRSTGRPCRGFRAVRRPVSCGTGRCWWRERRDSSASAGVPADRSIRDQADR